MTGGERAHRAAHLSEHPGGLAEPHPHISGRRLAVSGAALACAAAALYLLLPRLAGLHGTWARLREGDPLWLAGAAVLELASYAGYVVLFEAVLARPPSWLGRRESTLISIAGVAATRLLAAGGAGGVALTAWALRRSGLERRVVATRMVTFLVVLYGVFMIVLVLGGAGLWAGALPGPAPLGLTLVPAAFGAAVIAAALVAALVPGDLAAPPNGGRPARWLVGAAAAVGDGVREALRLVRSRDHRVALGAIAWWGFDVAVLWACVRAFGGELTVPVVVMSYFVGMIANLLPLPGGVGGVDGGMIAAMIGFGAPAGLAIAAVLSYRGISFWLPTLPGIVAYLRLLRVVRTWGPAQRGGRRRTVSPCPPCTS
jgi:uncharacterized membrane protein YbhN (UPF0104 family)